MIFTGINRVGKSIAIIDYRGFFLLQKKCSKGLGSIPRECHDNSLVSHLALTSTKIEKSRHGQAGRAGMLFYLTVEFVSSART